MLLQLSHFNIATMSSTSNFKWFWKMEWCGNMADLSTSGEEKLHKIPHPLQPALVARSWSRLRLRHAEYSGYWVCFWHTCSTPLNEKGRLRKNAKFTWDWEMNLNVTWMSPPSALPPSHWLTFVAGVGIDLCLIIIRHLNLKLQIFKC